MKTFFKDLAERAIKTFAQAMIGALGAGATGLIGVDWVQALSIAGFATLISILTSIASLGIGDDTASLVNNKKEGE
ncbi:holin [Lactococcus lactis]|uniref:holin n=1 Tax=Lactococcus lactis TaxID=1358 RepID=UPI0028912BC7|nr:holin [Lactococcus lactis]MDT2867111.1 holin [Lactococcus lactis]MDT2896230.1 holin [Lactococcus lactis]MDT2948624.1 holin [Lactococcus lactis]